MYSLCIYLRDGILSSTIPWQNTERASLPSWRKQHGRRTPPSDLSTPFALTSNSLWDISNPNIATIKSRFTFENKQEYHTRWDACKLPAFFFLFWSIPSLTDNQPGQLHFTKSLQWLTIGRDVTFAKTWGIQSKTKEKLPKKLQQWHSGKSQNAKIHPTLKKAGNSTMVECFLWCYWVSFFAVLPIIKLVLIYPQKPNPICSLQTKKQKLSSYVTTSHVFINWAAWLIEQS